MVENIESIEAHLKLDALAEPEELEEAHVKVHGPLRMLSVTSDCGRAGKDQRRTRIRGHLDDEHIVAGHTPTSCDGRNLRVAKARRAQSINYTSRAVRHTRISYIRTIGTRLAIAVSIQTVNDRKRSAGLNNCDSGDSPAACDLA